MPHSHLPLPAPESSGFAYTPKWTPLRLLIGAVLAFTIADAWRAIWWLSDVWILPDDKLASALVSMLPLGLGLHAILLLPTRSLCGDAVSPTGRLAPVLRRVWIVGGLIATVSFWRGAWILLDLWAIHDVGDTHHAGRLGVELAVCVVVLSAAGCLSGTFAPPVIFANDAKLNDTLAPLPWVDECCAVPVDPDANTGDLDTKHKSQVATASYYEPGSTEMPEVSPTFTTPGIATPAIVASEPPP